MFAACLVDRDRDCKLNVECVGHSVAACVEHLRQVYHAPTLAAEVLPGEERDGWYYVEIPGSGRYFQIFAVTVAGEPSAPGLPRRDDFTDKYEWRQAMLLAWQNDFKALVRRYMPVYPDHGRDPILELVFPGRDVPPHTEENDFMLELLYMLGDSTSVFSPYIWDDNED